MPKICCFNVAVGVHRAEGAEANHADGGQQRSNRLGKQLECGRTHMAQ